MDLEQLKRYLVFAPARTRADIWARAHDWAVSERAGYGLGGEGYGKRWGGYLYKGLYNLMRWDCSGDYYGLALLVDEIGRAVGLGPLRWSDGKTFRRTNAQGYYAASVPVMGEPRTSDMIFFRRPKSKRAKKERNVYHIVHVKERRDGEWWTGESRRGLESNRLVDVLARPDCIGLYRLPWFPDLGEVTLPPLQLGIAEMDLGGYRPTLGRGSKTFHVSPLKRCLNYHLGCRMSLTNWTFGRVTEKYVREFQALKGLPVTGVVDAATWAALLS